MLSMLEFRWLNIPSISTLLSSLFRESLLVAITNVQRISGSGMSDAFRRAFSNSHRFVSRGRPRRCIFMFIWLRVDLTVCLRVACVPQIALPQISFSFRGSFRPSLAFLRAVRHPLPVHHFLHHHRRCLTSWGYTLVTPHPGARVLPQPGRRTLPSILSILRHLYPITVPALSGRRYSFLVCLLPTPDLSNH